MLGIFSTAVAHTLWVGVTTRLLAATTSILSYCNIPIAMLASVIFLNEKLHWNVIVGASLIAATNIGGIYIQVKRGTLQCRDNTRGGLLAGTIAADECAK